MGNDPHIYIAIDYFATGEGRTVFLLITRADPGTDDYEIQPSFTSDGYDPGKLATTAEYRAEREMRKFAGEWLSHGIEILSRDEFFKRFGKMLPQELLENLTSSENTPCNLSYLAQLHYNFS